MLNHVIMTETRLQIIIIKREAELIKFGLNYSNQTVKFSLLEIYIAIMFVNIAQGRLHVFIS
jgi:hypothetical protein